MSHWMFECKQITELVSEGMDRKLPLWRRMGIRFHLMMCKLCSRYERQLKKLREAARHLGEMGHSTPGAHRLSEDTKRRMKDNLKDAAP